MTDKSQTKRRSFLKRIGVGLFAFVPTARALARGGATSVSLETKAVALSLDAFGDIVPGDTADAVLAKLGTPQSTGIVYGNGSPEWQYPDTTIRFLTSPTGEQLVQAVLSISQTESVKVTINDMLSEALPIRVGSAVSELKRVYGKALIDYGAGGLSLPLSGERYLDLIHQDGVLSLMVLRGDVCLSCKVVPGGQMVEGGI